MRAELLAHRAYRLMREMGWFGDPDSMPPAGWLRFRDPILTRDPRGGLVGHTRPDMAPTLRLVGAISRGAQPGLYAIAEATTAWKAWQETVAEEHEDGIRSIPREAMDRAMSITDIKDRRAAIAELARARQDEGE